VTAFTTEQVLREEAKAIHGDRFDCKDPTKSDLSGKALYRELYKLDSAALCLSGGGIRSAAFALGVIQALAVHPRPAKNQPVENAEGSLLARFHYLSTVSGGGYIGGWLSTWIARAGYRCVWKDLTDRPEGPDVEPPVIAWLRSYSNYLTPKLGIMSSDTWTAVALILRNLILNWLVILPVLCLVLLTLKFFAILFVWYSQIGKTDFVFWFYLALTIGCLCLIRALQFTTSNRPTRGDSRTGQNQFLRDDLLPAVAASILLMLALASPHAVNQAKNFLGHEFVSWWMPYVAIAVLGALVYAVAWVAGYFHLQGVSPKWKWPTDYRWDIFCWVLAGGIFGAAMAIGAHLYYVYVIPCGGFWVFTPPEVVLIVFGVPWTLVAQLFAEMIFVGLTSVEKDSDADREWLGRSAGWFLVAALGWIVTMLLVFVGSNLIKETVGGLQGWLSGVCLGAGGITAWLGKSQISPAQGAAKGWKAISANAALALGGVVFAVVLIVLGSAILDKVLYGQSLIATPAFNGLAGSSTESRGWESAGCLLAITLLAAALAVIIGAGASLTININRFYLHALYRNRLIRAFLGASRQENRNENPFTNFDLYDNPRVFCLWPQDEETRKGWRPFHIINMTLNLTSIEHLAWQERKAASFIATPRHTGSAVCHRNSRILGAYRSSKDYGDPRGISLGTAIAISGAAASSNMGYHSSPALSFLLTLFNVRLGWWLANPCNDNERIYTREGPRRAIVPLLFEMFGLMNEKSTYVYLSDGGHFENLGLYEMVRRRCRFIVISDAGCDPNFTFEDLGNAVRKIEIDLGVKINMSKLETLRARGAKFDVGANMPYWACGEIDYRVDGGQANGFLLYIKPGYHGDESAGIRAYASTHPDFPHQTTGDQFFSESQFESYRALGFEIADKLLFEAFVESPKKPPNMSNWTMEEFAGALTECIDRVAANAKPVPVHHARAELV
jgi:hypothetical protein